MKKIILYLVCFLLSTTLGFSTEMAATIEKADGKVIVYKSGSPRGVSAKDGMTLNKKDSLRTFKNSNAYIKFIDNSKIVITENSIMLIKDIKTVNLKNGKVVFEIQKQGDKEGVKVATKSAIIGVKGTKFLVSVNKDEIDIILKEGSISVKATKGEFKRYLKDIEEDFSNFVEDTKKDYEEYKRKMEEEFVEFVKEFTLEGNTGISIKKNEVKNIKNIEEFDEYFELMKNFN